MQTVVCGQEAGDDSVLEHCVVVVLCWIVAEMLCAVTMLAPIVIGLAAL